MRKKSKIIWTIVIIIIIIVAIGSGFVIGRLNILKKEQTNKVKTIKVINSSSKSDYKKDKSNIIASSISSDNSIHDLDNLEATLIQNKQTNEISVKFTNNGSNSVELSNSNINLIVNGNSLNVYPFNILIKPNQSNTLKLTGTSEYVGQETIKLLVNDKLLDSLTVQSPNNYNAISVSSGDSSISIEPDSFDGGCNDIHEFLNKYGESPIAYLIDHGLTPKEAYTVCMGKIMDSGELQTAFLNYGLKKV